MNKPRIILNPDKRPVFGRINQYFNLEQTIVFRIDTMEVRNPDPSILITRNKKLSSKSKEQFKRQDVR